MVSQTPTERIKQRRSQMLVHSFIYYHLDDSVVSDHTWQKWANELRDLQAVHGWQHGWYDDAFRDWNGSTGCHLPRDSWVINKALQLLRYREG
jgi:hypothetical protein